MSGGALGRPVRNGSAKKETIMVVPSTNRRWLAAAALAISVLTIGIDATVLNLALPTLAIDLHADTADLQWIVDGYLLVLGALMLPAGLLGDRFGRKRFLLLGLALFGLGSLACAYATDPGALIAARALLGAAAAMVMPLSLAVLPVMFAAAERQRAIAIVSSAAIAAYPVGPLLGGWLLTHFWWGSVFLINVPVVLLAMAAVTAFTPESHGQRRSGGDPVGILSSAAGLVALTYGVIEAGQRGWTDPPALAWIVAGLAALVGFAAWQRRLHRAGGDPMIDPGLFATPGYGWGTVLSTMVSFAMIGLLFAVPQYLRGVLGCDAMATGIRLLPMIAGMVLGLGLGDRASARLGAAATVGCGFAVMAAGYLLGATTSTSDGTGRTAWWIAVVGLGAGIVMPSAMNAALGGLGEQRSGIGTAVVGAIRQVGGTLGVAVLGSVLNTVYRDRVPVAGLPGAAAGAVRDNVVTAVATARAMGGGGLLGRIASAFVSAMDAMLAVSAAVALVSAVLAVLFLPGRRAGRRRARRSDAAAVRV